MQFNQKSICDISIDLHLKYNYLHISATTALITLPSALPLSSDMTAFII
uniref:Uncharacterized protein n=1 Tax=Inoviridae sp. ct1ro12 TaxID=2826756 RepID=A0A8S5R007_9VIRU|nr:MAG TPA: hypothetical protein [Inoviridae sp. ct1ro12]